MDEYSAERGEQLRASWAACGRRRKFLDSGEGSVAVGHWLIAALTSGKDHCRGRLICGHFPSSPNSVWARPCGRNSVSAVGCRAGVEAAADPGAGRTQDIQRGAGGFCGEKWAKLASRRRLYWRYSTSNIDIQDRIWAKQPCMARIFGKFAGQTRWGCPHLG